jgi:hypothetical protein
LQKTSLVLVLLLALQERETADIHPHPEFERRVGFLEQSEVQEDGFFLEKF